jgi:lipopolysaccharide/colanic/teichoic acid biosynthesis glycosyltransferase
VGTVSDDSSVDHFPGGHGDLLRTAEAYNIHEIVVSDPEGLQKDFADTLVECCNRGIKVSFTSRLYEELTGRVAVARLPPHWVRELPNRDRPYRAVKMSFDLAFGSLGLLILAVLFPLLAVAIKLDSPGPVFFRQIRVGFLGRKFRIFKLRTMHLDAEHRGPVWAQENDGRVTRVGRILRKLHLDELPQMINVFKGEMSIVGPRPERPEFVRSLLLHVPYYRARFLARPGITGWAQVFQGYSSSIEGSALKLEYDLFYLKRQSLGLDLLILLKTIGSVIGLKGR